MSAVLVFRDAPQPNVADCERFLDFDERCLYTLPVTDEQLVWLLAVEVLWPGFLGTTFSVLPRAETVA